MILKISTDIKWYAYISDSKLKMLHGQLVGEPVQRKLEWKLDLKIASVTRSIKESETEQSRESRLKDIVAALERNGQIGTIEEPKEFFRATLRMRWGIYEDRGRPESEAPLVYFGGYTPDAVLGLGGSTRHVVGCAGMANTTSRSATPYLVHHLLDGLDIDQTGWNAYPTNDSSEQHTFEAIALATSQLRGPTQEMEFVARTLLTGLVRHPIITGNERLRCILGTPLYVAYAKTSESSDPWSDPWLRSSGK